MKEPSTGDYGNGRRTDTPTHPAWLRVLIVCTAAFWIVTLIYMGALFFGGRIPSLDGTSSLGRSYIAMFYWGLNITDLIWFQLLTVAALVGLRRVTPWGWTAAILLSAIWVYTTTFFIIADVITGPDPVQAVYWFFFAYGLVSFGYLWKNRRMFWKKEMDIPS
jgi:hypothetical protein